MIAGIEIGGTKTVVGIKYGTELDYFSYIQIPTTQPEATFSKCFSWLHQQSTNRKSKILALGIASFGPIRLDTTTDDFGCILSTPKLGWEGYSVFLRAKQSFPDIPIVIETDVNAAALAEAEDCSDFVYITIGTGIGAGIVTGGRLIHGALHPELGHVRIPRLVEDNFAGCCPFHGDCLEGLASGLAVEKRWRLPGMCLPAAHLAWEWEAQYLAYGIIALMAIVSPKRVVIGGGVSQVPGLLERINLATQKTASSYFSAKTDHPFIRLPKLGQLAGLEGAFLLALNQI